MVQLASRWFVAVFVVVAMVGQVAAQEPVVMAPGDGAGGGATYADLLRAVIPDLELKEGRYHATRVVPLAHVADGYGGATPEPFIVASIPVLAFEQAGKPRQLLLVDLGAEADYAEGLAVLALYDMSGAPRLLDAVDVAFDRFTGFMEPARVVSPGGTGLVLTRSVHSNSNQAYKTLAILDTSEDRIRLVDTLRTFSERSCAGELEQEPSVKWTEADAFVLSVDVETRPGEEGCEAPMLEATRETLSVTYRRDAGGRSVPDSDLLKRLETDNEGRF